MSVRVTGLSKTLHRLRTLPTVSRAAARESVNRTAQHIAVRVRDRTSQTYNVSAETIGRYIQVKQAPPGETRAKVLLQVEPLPLSAFGARVVSVDVPVRLFGRAQRVIRRLKATALAVKRGQALRPLGGYFPLRGKAGVAFRRKGKARKPLTGLRLKTFPTRFLRKLRPEIEQQARRGLQVQFSAAFGARQRQVGAG